MPFKALVFVVFGVFAAGAYTALVGDELDDQTIINAGIALVGLAFIILFADRAYTVIKKDSE